MWFYLITGYIKGIEKIWFVGDEFVHNSYAEYYFQRSQTEFQGYVKDKYEMSGFMATNSPLDRSLVSRIRNNLLTAIREQPVLPRIVVVVLDDNIVNFIEQKNDTSSYTIGKVIHSIMTEHNRLICSQKDYLPNKAKRLNLPQVLWIEAPLHQSFINNTLRQKFNTCLQDMARLIPNVSVLSLKKVWDASDVHNYSEVSRKLTVHGYKQYWEAVDRTVCYCDTTIIWKKPSFYDRSWTGLIQTVSGAVYFTTGRSDAAWQQTSEPLQQVSLETS